MRPRPGLPVYMYWHDKATLPDEVQLCLASWKRLNSPQIYILDKSDLKRTAGQCALPLDVEKLTVEQQSDVMRLLMLYLYGGLYMDACIFLRKDISRLLGPLPAAYVMPLRNAAAPWVLENWLLWSPEPQSAVYGHWLERFVAILNDRSGEILRTTRTGSLKNPHYLTMHVAWLNCVQLGRFSCNDFAVLGRGAEVLAVDFYNPRDTLECLVGGIGRRASGPLVKFRGGERLLLKWHCSPEFRGELTEAKPADALQPFGTLPLYLSLILLLAALTLHALRRGRLLLAFLSSAALAVLIFSRELPARQFGKLLRRFISKQSREGSAPL